jgi:DEAD/DEAH box helicase domain-containing protein
MVRTTALDVGSFLREIVSSPGYRGQIVHVEEIPERPARFAPPARSLSGPVRRALAAQGIERLYIHQAHAIDRIREGRNVVVVTGTASGKTLCYNVPVLESLLEAPAEDPGAGPTHLYLFPTKALAQDQLKTLQRMGREAPELERLVRAGVYDGDTSQDARRKLRAGGNVILTNPDMLHQGILPYHTRWNPFLSRLRTVVVDEIHTYRGLFGSHVGNVLRRLRRVARFHGADPRFVACSATIANPHELAERLTGLPFEVVDEDGAPRGRKTFVFWNPPYLDGGRMERRSSNVEGHDLMVLLVEQGVQTIAFTKARVVAELVLRYVRESLERRGSGRADRVRAYRAGYLPEERRKIEKALFSGELLGVASTNALELGIDVGSLDASLLVGFPGTIASTWQQAGRAGRQTNEALVVLIAYNDPIDQYLMRHPEYFFQSSPEHAVIDPENPHVLARHLGAACFEIPLTEEDASLFGTPVKALADDLAAQGRLKKIERRWFWANTDFPSRTLNLRTMSDSTFTIVDRGAGNRTVGTVDAVSAPELVYPEGVYLHEGDTYLVRELDLVNKVAYVERAQLDYYTQPVLDASIRAEEALRRRALAAATAAFGPATVTWRTTSFKKIQFYGMDSIGYGKLDLPPQHLETRTLAITPSASVLAAVRAAGFRPIEGLSGLRNVAIAVLPFLVMCDRQDVGGIVDSSNTGSPTVFLYDRYPGGIGYAEKGYDLVEPLLAAALALVRECPCEEGCPSCVGLPVLRPAQHQDPDVMNGWPIPSKRAALLLLSHLIAGESAVPALDGESGSSRQIETTERAPVPTPHVHALPFEAPLQALPAPASHPAPRPAPRAPSPGEDLATRYVRFIESLRGVEELRPEFALLAEAGPEGVLFFDLETTGFAGTPLFLAGFMDLRDGAFQVRQHFARHYGEEAQVVAELLGEFRRARCLVTFNGKTFDLPFLRDRVVAHRLPAPPAIPHVDLLHAARRAWKRALPDCRLATLEWHICGRRRHGDVAGSEIPGLYHQYVKDGDPRPLGPVIEHNRMDLVTMAEILVELPLAAGGATPIAANGSHTLICGS